jgi:hypothetical protein
MTRFSALHPLIKPQENPGQHRIQYLLKQSAQYIVFFFLTAPLIIIYNYRSIIYNYYSMWTPDSGASVLVTGWSLQKRPGGQCPAKERNNDFE